MVLGLGLILNLFISNLLPVQAQTFRLDQQAPPKLELGVGLGTANFPTYPGADERETFILPFPSVVYRGDFIRADEDGTRSPFLTSERFELNGSFGFNVPVNESDVDVREGMGDLDAIIEVGPSLMYHLIKRGPKSPISLTSRTAIRQAFSTDLGRWEDQGQIFEQTLFAWIRVARSVTLYASISGTWATRRYQKYFYDVAPLFETTTRSRYDSSEGNLDYAASHFGVFNLGPRWSLFGGVSFRSYTDAANRRSPLHVRDTDGLIVLGFTYWFYRSKQTIEPRPLKL
ncbi:MAG: hypothetical protein CL675_06250 [Bdellovibrionaceae bacterium]|nr:hypothetical protein [Pseudobdellovibrionaceae bacterium]